MYQIAVAELKNLPFTDKLPGESRLSVWVRSTGYEVRFEQNRHALHIVLWLLVFVSMVGLSFFLADTFSHYAPYNYFAWALPALSLLIFLYSRFLAKRTRVRLDLTPMTIVISYLGQGDRAENQEHVPLKEIESFSIDNAKGLGLNISISEILHRTWIGSGLPHQDLQYLAALIVNTGKLSMQKPHPGAA